MARGILQRITELCGVTAFSNALRHPIAFAILGCLALAACGGGGGGNGSITPSPVVNQSVGGIWTGNFTTTAGTSVSGVALVTEDGRFFSEAKNLTNGCADVSTGTLSVNGSDVTGMVKVAIVSFTTSANIQSNCVFPDGSTSGSGTISGTIAQRSSLTFTGNFTTAKGTSLPSNTVTLSYDSLYSESSSLSKVAGNWIGPTGIPFTIGSNGTFSEQDPASGCVAHGQASIIDSKYNAYAFSVTYSSCLGSAAALNGLTATGVGALNDSVTPHLLILGYSVTLQNGATIIVVADATASSSPAAELLSISVTPTGVSLPVGATQQFVATGTYSDSSTADLTNSASWTSGTPAIATVNATSGLATAVAVGSTVVTATSGSVSGSTTLNVTTAALESIAVTSSPPSVGITNTIQLTAIGSYSDGNSANVTTVATWLSSDSTLATVAASTGVVTGVALGSVTITASVGTVIGTEVMTVIPTTWHQAASMAAARAAHTATLLSSGVVLAAGGFGISGNNLASAELYDPVANMWSAAGSLATARENHTATALPNGLVLVAGGDDSTSQIVILSSCELYNPMTNAWSAAANLITARQQHTATPLSNGQVLAVGGSVSGGSSASAELYDSASNTWSAAASLANARVFGHTATLLANGKVLVVGGYDGTLFLSSAELYDPVANTWTAVASLATARGQHAAAALLNGQVLVAGGSGNGATPGSAVLLGTAEIYDPVANTWSPASSLATARVIPTANVLQNGHVLVAGGSGAGSPSLSSAELYDPVANTWSATTNLIMGRRFHTATLLQTGEVLAVGGVSADGSGTELSSSELYP
jgi:N-acetylneuraminic acid mutarotase